MRIVLLFLLAAALEAGVVQGVVLDRETGAPLARTLVSLIPVEGTRAQTVNLFTAERGTFAVINVTPGWYILRGSRKVYVTGEVGQLRPGRPGRPFEVERDDQSFFLELRLTRMGAVAGVVVDENNVGLPEWDVHAYTAKPPVRRIAQGKTDDRGVFRIHGLDPGNYFIRSGEGDVEDGSTFLPTYHKFGIAVSDAAPVEVRYGETTPDLRVQPLKGKLWSLQGTVSGACERLTMITDTGRRSLSVGAFSVERLPPGRIDLLAEGNGYGGLLPLTLDRDLAGRIVPCSPIGGFGIAWDGDAVGRRLSGSSRSLGTISMRRIDLDGIGEPRITKQGDTVSPGIYEATAVPEDESMYVTAMYADTRRATQLPDGSFQVEFSGRPPGPAVVVTLRKGAPQISGVVTSDAKPVVGAPVYIEMIDPRKIGPDARLRLWSLRTDVSGRFGLRGLRPGRYRILSSFDFDPLDGYAMERAQSIDLREGDSSMQELKMLP